jgi:lysyl-tRNA synthetase, class II
LEFEPLDQYLQRKKKLAEMAALGEETYPHRFDQTATAAEIAASYGSQDAQTLESQRVNVRVAGRIRTIRLHGKTGFAHIQGAGTPLQIYVKRDAAPEAFRLFELMDMGDLVGVGGYLFRTKTGELTVWVEKLTLLAKSLLPLPEKWHGLTDVEVRYRQRYLDLIVNAHAREIFARRAAILRELRNFFDSRGYTEVETPMMHSIAGGAAARPFITHHNTYDVDLYLRIAPELYLKRLVVGGLERVYEINRNFRNEGVSAEHNPEFTMLEFYQAYSDYRDLMDLTEELFASLARKVCGTTVVKYGEHELDFGKWQRLTMREAIGRYWPAGAGAAPSVEELGRPSGPRAAAERYNLMAQAAAAAPAPGLGPEQANAPLLGWQGMSDGELTGLLFETVAEPNLIQPTMIYDFPTDISPLAKCRPDDPSLVERFEVFVAGLELGNAFSELNDPDEQERRLLRQVSRGGDEVPREVDFDYLRALAHGLPPTAGMGIGIDRLTMLLTDSRSIREVILFPLLRPEATAGPADARAAAQGADGGTQSEAGSGPRSNSGAKP